MSRRRPSAALLLAGLILSALPAGASAQSPSPGGGAASPDDGTASPAGRWFLMAVNDEGLLGLVDSRASITLADDGTVTGHTGCNTLSTSYSVDGAAIELAPVVTTKVACADEGVMASEAALITGLEAAATWDVTDGELGLRDADGELLLVFREPSVEGVWTLVELPDEDLVGVVEDTGVTAVFSEDTLAGNTGCNVYSGPYRVDGSTIEIGPLTMTMRACVDESRGAIEDQVLTAFDAAATWAITDDGWLELYDSEGALLVGFLPDRTAMQ